MIRVEYTTLMQQEVDGANSPDESRRLREFLEGSPEGRRYYDELRATAGIFAQAGEVEPPARLRGDIMAAVEGVEPAGAASATGDAHEFSRLNTDRRTVPQAPRAGWRETLADLLRIRPQFAYGLAVGLVVGVCLLGLYWWQQPAGPGGSGRSLQPGTLASSETGGPGSPDAHDPDNPPLYDFYASVVPPERSTLHPASELVHIEGQGIADPGGEDPSISGSVRALYRRELIVVRLHLQSTSPVEVLITCGDAALCMGYRTKTTGRHDLSVDQQTARLSHDGTGDYEVLFELAGYVAPGGEAGQTEQDQQPIQEPPVYPPLEIQILDGQLPIWRQTLVMELD